MYLGGKKKRMGRGANFHFISNPINLTSHRIPLDSVWVSWSTGARGEDVSPPPTDAQLSLLCRWSPSGQGMRKMASAAHTLTLDHGSLDVEWVGKHLLNEMSWVSLFPHFLPVWCDRNSFSYQTFGRIAFFCLFYQGLHTKALLSWPGKARKSFTPLRHGKPECCASPAPSWMLSDKSILIKDLSLKYFWIIKEKKNERKGVIETLSLKG